MWVLGAWWLLVVEILVALGFVVFLAEALVRWAGFFFSAVAASAPTTDTARAGRASPMDASRFLRLRITATLRDTGVMG
jgi:hypothetical protein